MSPDQSIVPGTAFAVMLTAMIDPGWHVYALTQGPGGPVPTRISLGAGLPFAFVDSVAGPAPVLRFDPNFGIAVEMYEGTAQFALPVRAAADAKVERGTVAVNVSLPGMQRYVLFAPSHRDSCGALDRSYRRNHGRPRQEHRGPAAASIAEIH